MADGLHKQIVRDLSHKASDDTQAVLRRAFQFAKTPFDMMEMASMSAACALAYSAAAQNAHLSAGHTPEEVTDALWEILRPMVLKNLGGGDAEFRALLERCGDPTHG